MKKKLKYILPVTMIIFLFNWKGTSDFLEKIPEPSDARDLVKVGEMIKDSREEAKSSPRPTQRQSEPLKKISETKEVVETPKRRSGGGGSRRRSVQVAEPDATLCTDLEADHEALLVLVRKQQRLIYDMEMVIEDQKRVEEQQEIVQELLVEYLEEN